MLAVRHGRCRLHGQRQLGFLSIYLLVIFLLCFDLLLELGFRLGFQLGGLHLRFVLGCSFLLLFQVSIDIRLRLLDQRKSLVELGNGARQRKGVVCVTLAESHSRQLPGPPQHLALLILLEPQRVVGENILENADDVLSTFRILGEERQLSDIVEHPEDVLAIIHVHVLLGPPVKQLDDLRKLRPLWENCCEPLKALQNIHIGFLDLRHLVPSSFFASSECGNLLLIPRQMHALLAVHFASSSLCQMPLHASVFLDFLCLMVEVSIQLALFASSA
mmetsp:Transcript_28475/g.66794  ORF Transcript_28475/g.66794 Transcript_28475/m.66794 type:complete len:275 (-) Transcript_28475:254-1078(-)